MKKTHEKPLYFCELCDFKTSNKKDFTRHSKTAKHINSVLIQQNSTEIIKKPINNHNYICQCGKKYKDRTGLWKHRKSCNLTQLNTDNMSSIDINNDMSNINNTSDINVLTNTMMQLIKQNQEFKEIIIELAKKDTTTNNNNNTINNNNNQKFNLNFFLNNTCKDAMNMSEFIENIEVQFEDIENIGRNGYVTGMTEMILSRIKNLDITKRPVHCTDVKRETMYIKDNNEWERDTPDNKKLQKMISMIAKRNYATIPLWRNEHPESEDMNNPMYNFNIDILRNVLGDVGDGQIRLDKKIIKNISKCITVEK